MAEGTLEPRLISDTVNLLATRGDRRFPQSGLSKVAAQLSEIAARDPEWILNREADTGAGPSRPMTPFELSRYLDYCSEMLSMTGKIAALYIQRFDDTVALQAVNEVESVTTGLSGKIWQKLMILYALRGTEQENRG
jgi:hypothetical protein